MLKPDDLERLRSEAMVDERTMYRLAARKPVRSDVRARIERAAKRLGVILPRGLFVDENAA